MKSYSVKSNAKRFARGLAEKYSGVTPVEPVPTDCSKNEWWPAVRAENKDYADAVADVAVVVNIREIAPYPEPLAEDASGMKAAFDAVTPATEGDLEPVKVEPLVFSAETIASRPELSKLDIAQAAASLPPPVKSTREEIDARRAERRARIDAEKAEGTRTATGAKVKINKTTVILDLVKRPNGATQTELEAATGWQRHTLRGYIAGTLRKRLAPLGKDIECRRVKGQETRYVLADVKGGEV
ncbi:DUF3489 domain-containing protein [Ensifer sp. LCM 4579]|uniref:DUF3489 domain-containing protein n=1 Tax=Ensifer sp. LCM 4579 TaxID=1848292 RepID=UPI0008D95AF8|nr:DUF3489 domain-containing protein [Ensifer sp. LCM 4579]OHV85794.1 hypothetical protein LCM4579_00025 [Ensifer sp. LCM 4579]